MGLTRENLNASARVAVCAAVVAVAGIASGCMSAPTYGTDKTATEQLATDLSNIASIGPKKRAAIDYTPRPDLVKPAKGEAALPPPQEAVTTVGNPSWPEAPEQRLARIRAEADANVDDPNYKSPVIADQALSARAKPVVNSHSDESGVRNPSTVAAENAEFKKRLAETQQGSSTSRKYLSEPPIDYRQASADAPQGEIGEDESDKERRLKREARKKTGRGMNLDDLNPF